MNRILNCFLLLSLVIVINSCSSKGSNSPAPNPTDPCAGVVSVSATAANTNTGQSTGSISATATGGSGFTYSINNGTFQTSGSFANLAAGTYTITAKNSNGCTATTSVTVNSTVATNQDCVGTAGPLFAAVKNLLAANCVSCHNNSQQEGGMNWTVDCNIVTYRDRIKARAVDANPSQMPPPPNSPLSATDKKKITDWIAAGGKITN